MLETAAQMRSHGGSPGFQVSRPGDGAGGGDPKQWLLRLKERLIVVEESTIDSVEAARNYVRFHLGTASYRVRATLADVERDLSAERFVRIHRSAILNLSAVTELSRGRYGDLAAVLKNGRRLAVGRSYRPALQAALPRIL